MIWHKHHIVPKHAGGADDSANIIKCNVAMHSFLHKIRWEELGEEYDRLAWLGLEGILSKQEIILEAAREGGRISGKLNKGRKLGPQSNELKSKRVNAIKNNSGYSHIVKAMNDATSIGCSFISPNGKVYYGKSIRKFAREHNLNASHLSKVNNDKSDHHKGWRKVT